MANNPEASEPVHPGPHGAIGDRVRQRLALAGQAFDRRAAAVRPRTRRRGRPPAAAQTPPADPARERACLRTVFLELGDAHRSYRARTGHTVTPALRAAATAFKQAPSVNTLVPVVAFLDELGILGW